MDWLLTVPLLLIEIVLVMKLSPEETKKQSLRLGVLSGLMILNGYPGRAPAMPPPGGPTGLCPCCPYATSCTPSSSASRSRRMPSPSASVIRSSGLAGHRHLVVHLPRRVHPAHAFGLRERQGWSDRLLHGRHPGRLHRL